MQLERASAAKKNSACRPPALPALLFRQVCILGWLAGLFHPYRPLPALTALLLLLLTDTRLFGLWFEKKSAENLARNFARAAVILVCFAAGSLYARAALPEPPPSERFEHMPKERWRGVITEVRGLPDGRLRILLRDLLPLAPDLPAPPGLTALVWEKPALRPQAGQTLEGAFRVYPARGFANPGLSDAGESLRMRGIFFRAGLRGNEGDIRLEGTPDAFTQMRENLRSRLLAALERTGYPPVTNKSGGEQLLRLLDRKESPASGILPALIFGDRFFLNSELMERMAATGLAHSLALSGQHLAVAGLFALFTVSLAGRLAPGIFLRMPRRKLLVLAGLPFAALYLWIGDAPLSLIRAGIMTAFPCLYLMRNTAFTALDALFATALCISLLSPLAVHDLGLQLSVLSVSALVLCLPLLERLPLPSARRFFHTLLRRSVQILLISLAVQLALLPLLLRLFGFVSPWFFLNLFWLPVLGLFVLPPAAAALPFLALNMEGPAEILLHFAVLPCEGLLVFLDFLATRGLLEPFPMLRPHWTAFFAFAALAVAASLLPGRPCLPPTGRRLLVAAALFLCVGPFLRYIETTQECITLKLMDVGQGQATLLELPGGKRTLIDGGNLFSPRFDAGRDILAPVLSDNRAPRLERVINSHPDRDHLYGLFFLLRRFDVGEFAWNGDERSNNAERLKKILAARGLEAEVPRAGQSIALDARLKLEVLHPPAGYRGNANNSSLILRLMRDEMPLALIPGDAERPALLHLLASGRDIRAPVLILPHHGAFSGFCPELYDAVGARIALASNGPSSRFPATEVRRALAERGIRLLETYKDGQIRVRWDKTENMSIESAHGYCGFQIYTACAKTPEAFFERLARCDGLKNVRVKRPLKNHKKLACSGDI